MPDRGARRTQGALNKLSEQVLAFSAKDHPLMGVQRG